VMATELRACTWVTATARLWSLAPSDGDRVEGDGDGDGAAPGDGDSAAPVSIVGDGTARSLRACVCVSVWPPWGRKWPKGPLVLVGTSNRYERLPLVLVRNTNRYQRFFLNFG
jgi:hypothetical protein